MYTELFGKRRPVYAGQDRYSQKNRRNDWIGVGGSFNSSSHHRAATAGVHRHHPNASPGSLVDPEGHGVWYVVELHVKEDSLGPGTLKAVYHAQTVGEDQGMADFEAEDVLMEPLNGFFGCNEVRSIERDDDSAIHDWVLPGFGLKS